MRTVNTEEFQKVSRRVSLAYRADTDAPAARLKWWL